MITNIARMTRDDCVRTMGDIAAEVKQLKESKHRLSVEDEATLSALTDDFEELRERVERLDLKSRFAGPEGRAKLNSGGFKTISGSTEAPEADDDRDDSTRVPGRDQAMRTLEQHVASDLVPARSAEHIERQLASGPLMARGWTARWIAATGSDAYRSAWTKKALSDDGHLTWTKQEAEAWRIAATVQAERAAMSLTDNQGGYLVPFQLDPSVLLTSGGSTNPILQLARTELTTTDVWSTVTSAGVTAEWLSENTEAAEASPTFGQPNVPCYKASAFASWSYEVGMDAVNFVDEVAKLLVDGLEQLVSEAVTVGSGIGQPTGVVTGVAANGGSVVSPTTAETFAAADLFKVQNAAAPRWQANSTWMMNLAFLNATKQFETSNGALQFPELRNSPAMLLGRPAVENSHMDAAINAAATEDNHVVLYGDFRQFVVTIRSGSTFELIPNLVGNNGRPSGTRGGFLWARYGSSVLVPNAFRLLSIPTTA